MPVFEAARSTALDRYASWIDSERSTVTVATIYHEISNDLSLSAKTRSFEEMAQQPLSPDC